MILLRKYIAVLGAVAMVGCASSDHSLASKRGSAEQPRLGRESIGSEMKRNLEDFVGMTSAYIRKAGQDVRSEGYTVIFTDVGPESLERDEPDVFRDLIERSSGNGVQVRGFSRVEEKGGFFRDKQTGEKGVALFLIDLEEDDRGGRIVTGSWSEGPGQKRPHVAKYVVEREGTQWTARAYVPTLKVTGGKPFLPGVSFFDGPEKLSGQLVFQRLDYEQPNRVRNCISNVVYSLDLQTKAIVQIADLGALDARLVKVSDDGRMLCFYHINGANGRFFVHSVEKGQTKQVKFPDAIQDLGIAVLGNSVFVASYNSGPLYQFEFDSGALSEFRPAALPVLDRKWLPTLSYPRTHFSEPGVLYFEYGALVYYRWTQSSGELKELPDFSYCMTADGKHVWLGERGWSSYPLVISSTSQLPSINLSRERDDAASVGETRTLPKVITQFRSPGGRGCRLEQLSPCGGFALLSAESGGLHFSGSVNYYIVDLADGHTRILLGNEYATLRQDLGGVTRVFWVKKIQ